MANANVVSLLIKADADQATRTVNSFAETVRRNRVKIGLAFTAIGAAGLLMAKSVVSAHLEQQRAVSVLAALIESSGDSWDRHRVKVMALTSALQAKTNFGDEQQIRVLSRMIPVLGSVEKAMAALPAVLDAAAASGLGVESVAGTLSRALAGMVNTSESTGLTFDKTADFAERLALVFGAVGGAAEANVDPFTQMTNTIGDLKEMIGEALMPTLVPLVETLKDIIENTIAWAKENSKLLSILVPTAAGLAALALVVGPLIIALPFLAGGFAVVTTAVSALGVALGISTGGLTIILGLIATFGVAYATNLLGIRDITNKVIGRIIEMYESWAGWFLPGGSLIKAILFLKDNWREVWDFITAHLQKRLNQMRDDLNELFEGLHKFAQFFGGEFTFRIKEFGFAADLVGGKLRSLRDDLVAVGNAANVSAGFLDRRLNKAVAALEEKASNAKLSIDELGGSFKIAGASFKDFVAELEKVNTSLGGDIAAGLPTVPRTGAFDLNTAAGRAAAVIAALKFEKTLAATLEADRIKAQAAARKANAQIRADEQTIVDANLRILGREVDETLRLQALRQDGIADEERARLSMIATTERAWMSSIASIAASRRSALDVARIAALGPPGVDLQRANLQAQFEAGRGGNVGASLNPQIIRVGGDLLGFNPESGAFERGRAPDVTLDMDGKRLAELLGQRAKDR